MKPFTTITLAAAALLTAATAGAVCGRTHQHPTVAADLPLHAVPGECYAKVVTPAQYRDVTEQVIQKEATETVRIIPAVYETVSEEVLVRPATARTVDVPAVYEVVHRQIEVEPSRNEWRVGDCNPKAIVDNATGECWCLVEIPPVMRTVSERVVRVPATTRQESIPAEYEMVQKKVLVTPERVERTPVPAVFGTVVHRELVSPERAEWVEIPCEAGHRAKAHSSNEFLSFSRISNRVH